MKEVLRCKRTRASYYREEKQDIFCALAVKDIFEVIYGSSNLCSFPVQG